MSAAPEPVPAEPLTIAVIGSARIEPPDPRCALAERTGAAIAAQGWITLTGGYGGLMGAVTAQPGPAELLVTRFVLLGHHVLSADRCAGA